MVHQSKLSISLILLSFLFFTPLFSQDQFHIENSKGRYTQKFKLINDLVIVPVEINGRELSFLLDTGVNSTILFSLSEEDTTVINNPVTVYLKGLGGGKPLRGLQSSHNLLKIGDIVAKDHSLYIIPGDVVGISNRLGVEVNGILGYDFFKDLIIEFNYKRQRMKVYEREAYEYKKCRKCVDLPLYFYKGKPYLDAEISEKGKMSKSVRLLIDSGSGDALWLFKNPERDINIPDKSFEDFLGFGITGSVYGQRSRIKGLNMGKFDLRDITVSYPDSLYLQDVNSFEERDGSIGSQVLRRFHSVFDYERKMLRIKPNSDFKDPFEYNMSGIVVEHKGYNIVTNAKSSDPVFALNKDNQNKGTEVYRSTWQIVYSLEPSYKIAEIRPNSPAEESGLMIGDEIIKLNGRPVYRYNLEKISQIFSSKEGRRIKLSILRRGVPMEIEFRLERIL